MKNLRKFQIITLLILPLFLGLGQCNKPDDTVIISYQHLANFQSWNLEGKGGTHPSGMWHAYMLRGIVNKGKDAKSFTFNLQKLATKNGGNVISSETLMSLAFPETMPSDFTANVEPQGAYTVPFGTGALFFIKDDNDTEQTPVTNLVYKISSNESVIMVMLEPTAPVMYSQLNDDFLNQIHAKQNEYENAYDPGGKKK